jgi:hypothetical protein
MATVVFINRLQPADGKRDALIGLLREFADSIHADPGIPSLFGADTRPHSRAPSRNDRVSGNSGWRAAPAVR